MTRDANAESWGGIKRQNCEVFSRVVGYLRRIDSWNDGKREEYSDRKTYEYDLKGEKA